MISLYVYILALQSIHNKVSFVCDTSAIRYQWQLPQLNVEIHNDLVYFGSW